jgi:hypothetical protein
MALFDTWVDGGSTISVANPVGALALHISNTRGDPTMMQSTADG